MAAKNVMYAIMKIPSPCMVLGNIILNHLLRKIII